MSITQQAMRSEWTPSNYTVQEEEGFRGYNGNFATKNTSPRSWWSADWNAELLPCTITHS